MKNIKTLLVVCLMVSLIAGCSSGNLEDVKAHAADEWRKVGFKPIGYRGYEWGLWGFNDYGGAEVWYNLERIPDNGIIYSGFLYKWGNEYHSYSITARDAIKPN